MFLVFSLLDSILISNSIAGVGSLVHFQEIISAFLGLKAMLLTNISVDEDVRL